MCTELLPFNLLALYLNIKQTDKLVEHAVA
jgi:hypothetical protein